MLLDGMIQNVWDCNLTKALRNIILHALNILAQYYFWLIAEQINITVQYFGKKPYQRRNWYKTDYVIVFRVEESHVFYYFIVFANTIYDTSIIVRFTSGHMSGGFEDTKNIDGADKRPNRNTFWCNVLDKLNKLTKA